MILEQIDGVRGVVAQLLRRRDHLVEPLRRRRLLAQRVDQLADLLLHGPAIPQFTINTSLFGSTAVVNCYMY